MFNYVDYFKQYGRIMQFNQNKHEPIHRWYPFVEGYSKEFIASIIHELPESPILCLEPFSGSGTTALELQNMGICCHSFEVNPFMFLLASVKLEDGYSLKTTLHYFNNIKKLRNNYECCLPETPFKTLYENEKVKKWNYSHEVGIALEKLKIAINSIPDAIYRNLFTVALASILLDVSNLYRNGKCLSYKPNWKNRILSQEDVFACFDKKVSTSFIDDINTIEKTPNKIRNKDFLYFEDARVGIETFVKDNSIDLVITSPPYLNSRDYTDTYMLELKTLNMTPSFESILELRKKTIRSHVQVHWNNNINEETPLLVDTIRSLTEQSKNQIMWNNSIIDMVNLYFVDMRNIFTCMYKKLRQGGRVYFNVSNSAYFGVEVNTLEICASIAQDVGFEVEEIRKARLLKTSPQQKKAVGSLLEGIIVMHK